LLDAVSAAGTAAENDDDNDDNNDIRAKMNKKIFFY